MVSKAKTPDEYIKSLPADRQKPMSDLRKVILKNLPKGFVETMNYGMIGYVVPHSLYPDGYHCDPKMPLPFMNIASQKNFIAFYYMGFAVDKKLYEWFAKEYEKYTGKKVDAGKACVRYKKPEHIPFELIGELAGRITPQMWIELYEKNVKTGAYKK